mgnify:FL=1
MERPCERLPAASRIQDPAHCHHHREQRHRRLPQRADRPEKGFRPQCHRSARHRRGEEYARPGHGLRRRRKPSRHHPIPGISAPARSRPDRLPHGLRNHGRAQCGNNPQGYQAGECSHRLLHIPEHTEDRGLRHRIHMRLDIGHPHSGGSGNPLVHGAGSQRRIQVLPRHGCLLAGNRAVRDGLWGHPVQRTLQLRHRSPRSNRPHTSHWNSRLTLGSPQHDAGQESGCASPDRRGETESGSPRTRTHGNPRSARPGILPLHTRDVGRSRDSQPAGQSSESGERRNPRRIASGHLAAPVERRARHTPGTPGIPGVPDFPGIPAPWGAPLRHRHPGARVR